MHARDHLIHGPDLKAVSKDWPAIGVPKYSDDFIGAENSVGTFLILVAQ